jgi:hypothetical protein
VDSAETPARPDWFAGDFEAEGANGRRLAQLFALAGDAKTAGVRPLSARDLTRTLSDGTTILGLLAADQLDPDPVRAILTQFAEVGHATRLRTAAAARERHGWRPISEGAAERNLEANLDDFTDG